MPTAAARAGSSLLVGLLSVAFVAVTAPAAAHADDCVVTDGQLDWGFKESFRSYISGSIANGEWTVADGTSYETPSFGWSAATGTYEAGTGQVGFTGSITFTGHGEILNTTVANPRVRFDGDDSAVLLLDVTGTTQQGDEVDEQNVEFADLELADALVETDGAVSITAAPAVLTADGAAAFGTYAAGEPLDPVSLRFDAACGVQPAPGNDWMPLALIGALGIAAVATVVVVVRRRSAAGPTQPTDS